MRRACCHLLTMCRAKPRPFAGTPAPVIFRPRRSTDENARTRISSCKDRIGLTDPVCCRTAFCGSLTTAPAFPTQGLADRDTLARPVPLCRTASDDTLLHGDRERVG